MILKELHTMNAGGYPSAWMRNIFASLMILHTEQNLWNKQLFPLHGNGCNNSTEQLYVQVYSCFTEDSTPTNEITTVFLQLNDTYLGEDHQGTVWEESFPAEKQPLLGEKKKRQPTEQYMFSHDFS